MDLIPTDNKETDDEHAQSESDEKNLTNIVTAENELEKLSNTQPLEIEPLTRIKSPTSSRRPKRLPFPELVQEENEPNVPTTERFVGDVLEMKNDSLSLKKSIGEKKSLSSRQ